MGRHFLLQGILPTQGLIPHFLHLLQWQVDSLPLVATWEADMLASLPLLMLLFQLFQVRKSGILISFVTAHHLPNLVMFPL